MPPLVRIQEELRDLTAVQFVAGAFAEVSIKKMQTLKQAFEHSRAFYEDIRHLYAIVRAGQSKSAIADLPSSGPSIAVALTSNHRFYGSLNRDVIASFQDGLWQSAGEGLVIGRTGKLLLERTPYADRVPTLLFHDDMPTEKELKLLLERLFSYRKVYFYYPQFVTILSQRVAVIDISEDPEADASIVGVDPDLTHIFEPEFELLAQFFETAIRRYLLSRVLFESEVARTGARMVSMSEAEERAGVAIRERRSAARHMHESMQSMRLLETVNFRTAWKRKKQSQ